MGLLLTDNFVFSGSIGRKGFFVHIKVDFIVRKRILTQYFYLKHPLSQYILGQCFMSRNSLVRLWSLDVEGVFSVTRLFRFDKALKVKSWKLSLNVPNATEYAA